MKPKTKLIIFTTLVLLCSALLWGSLALLQIPVSNLETTEPANPFVMTIFILNGFMPSIIGVILIILTEKEDRKKIFSSLLPKKHNIQSILQITLLFCLCFAMQILLYVIFIGSFDFRMLYINLYQILPLIILGPLSEEIGWRGYMQKQVNKILTPVKGSILIGIIWAIWHLPLFYIIGTTQQANNVSFLTFSVLVILISWITTFYYMKNKGSLFVSVFIHWIYTSLFSFYILSTDYSILSDLLSIVPYLLLSIYLYYRYRKSLYLQRRLYEN